MSDTTCREAGRIGGTTTRDRHGQAYFKAIGRLGGLKRMATTDRATRQALGTKGGTACRDAHHEDYYREMGRVGGEKLLAQRGIEYYRAIGRLAQAARRRGSDS